MANSKSENLVSGKKLAATSLRLQKLALKAKNTWIKNYGIKINQREKSVVLLKKNKNTLASLKNFPYNTPFQNLVKCRDKCSFIFCNVIVFRLF